MSIGVLHGQTGGIKLPFRVIGGTTQPSNPKDGTIWVKTSVPITRTEFANGTWASGGVGLVFLAGTLGGSNPTGTNTTVWAINKNTGASKYVLKITLTGCKQVQGSKGNWVSLDAYRYYGGKWVQFSSEFTATINVTYPAGSTCTATDGTTTLTAPNTSGTWACVVPNAGTWTVAIESLGRSVDVVITDNGQSESVSLSYVFLYDKGDQCTGLTGDWKFQKANDAFGASGTGKANSDNLSISTPSNNTVAGAWRTNNKIDLTNYSTLYVTFSEINTDTSFSSMCISVKQTLSTADNATTNMLRAEPLTSLLDTNNYPKFTAPYTAVMDVSALSGDYYIIWGVSKSNSRMAVSTTSVTEVYLT